MKSAKNDSLFCGELFAAPVPESHRSEISAEISCDFGDLFERLAQSSFRSRFRLTDKEKDYIKAKGWEVVSRHAAELIGKRLAPAVIANDGRQTPMRGHPVFIAQHATGCCCRGCFEKWHHIPAGRELTAAEQRYVVAVLMEWIRRQMEV